jgi:hypothetical protein
MRKGRSRRGGARCFAAPARSIPSEGPLDLPIRLRRTGLSPLYTSSTSTTPLTARMAAAMRGSMR